MHFVKLLFLLSFGQLEMLLSILFLIFVLLLILVGPYMNIINIVRAKIVNINR